MKNSELEREVLYDGGSPFKKKELKGPKSNYPSFDRMINNFHQNLFESNKHFNVDSVIGNMGSKILYSKNGFYMEWTYKKNWQNSGEHKKHDGTINIKNASKLAVVQIKEGYAIEIIIYNTDFADKIKEHKDMPLYKEISDILH